MAGNKYVAISGLDLTEVVSVQASAGAGDAGKIPALDASGLLDATMLPSSGAVTLTASEALSAGDMINLHNSSGIKMRKADNTSASKRAHGFVNSAVSNGATGTAMLRSGVNTGVSGLTVGAEYVLGATGGVTVTAPTTAGHILQGVGVARSATELEVILTKPCTRA